ncbi:hypothetical protein OJ792_002254 [Salmonella enterica]|nr:hypothetical protein [Salmonella enterica]EKA2210363.1 hypothetical protein [Salmonella enterica]
MSTAVNVVEMPHSADEIRERVRARPMPKPFGNCWRNCYEYRRQRR